VFKSVFTRLFWNNLIMVLTALFALVFTLIILVNDYITDTQFDADMRAAKNIENLTVLLQIEYPDYRNYEVYSSMLMQYADFTESDITVVDASGRVYATTAQITKVPAEYNEKVLSGDTIKTFSLYSAGTFVI